LEMSEDFRPYIESGKLNFKRGRLQRLDKEKLVTFGDGSQEKIDTIVLCTGYKFSFPFLNPKDGIIGLSHRDKYWGPLYKRMFAINEPDLIFIGNHDTGFYLNIILER
jgi:hypothetical protein